MTVLGRILHTISHLQILFWCLGLFFQFKTMFLSEGKALFETLNTTLLMYGIAMAIGGLRDNNRISEKARREFISARKIWRWVIVALFIAGLFSLAVGGAQFLLTTNRELGWAITTFGLGMIALGRQRYDAFMSFDSAEAASDLPIDHLQRDNTVQE